VLKNSTYATVVNMFVKKMSAIGTDEQTGWPLEPIQANPVDIERHLPRPYPITITLE
jgi:hypothetical protein